MSASTGGVTTGTGTGTTTIADSEGMCGDDCQYLDPPPIACYEFEDLSALVDSRECGFDGALSGVEAVDGVVNMGARVDANSTLSVPGGLLPELPEFTLTAWIAIPAETEGAYVVLNKDQHVLASLTPPPMGSSKWKVNCTIGANELNAEQVALSPDGKWHMLACGCDSVPNNSDVCAPFTGLNGARVQGEGPWLTRPLSNSSEFEITPNYDGCIDSIQIWDRALTTEELVALHQKGIAMMPPACPAP